MFIHLDQKKIFRHLERHLTTLTSLKLFKACSRWHENVPVPLLGSVNHLEANVTTYQNNVAAPRRSNPIGWIQKNEKQ